MNFEELIEKLNNLKIEQTEYDWFEDIPEEFIKEFEGSETMESEIDIDKHRWYEISTQVIKIKDRYLGIRHITNMYSEQSSITDIGNTLIFFEMKPVETITYIEKQ